MYPPAKGSGGEEGKDSIEIDPTAGGAAGDLKDKEIYRVEKIIL